MKRTLFTLLFTGLTLSLANQTMPSSTKKTETIKHAIKRVEDARISTISALQKMIKTVENARASSTNKDISIATKILETHALSEIAKSTANVEMTKIKSSSLIHQAIDTLDPESLKIIANSIAEVEIAKAKAKEKIIKVTQNVELSKTQQHPPLKYPNETLTIAKNLAAIQIAKSVSQTQMQKAIASVEDMKASSNLLNEDSNVKYTQKDKEKLESIKAKATANISSYLAQIEVVKANMIAKIAKEIAKVEIAKIKALSSDKNKNTLYPSRLIKMN